MAETFSTHFETFAARMRDASLIRCEPDSETPLIEVDEAVRSIAGFYERTRNTLEYGEADFFRQRAIERSLRRILGFGSSRSPEERALDLLRELIRAGYLPNEAIPETIAVPIGTVIARLLVTTSTVDVLFHDELIRFAVFEIENAIFPERAAAQAATVAFVVHTCDKRLTWPRGVKDERGHRAFLFVAAHRAVLNADSTRILFAFVRDAFPQWREAPIEELSQYTDAFERVLATAKRTIAHKRTEQYTRALRRIAPAFRALEDATMEAEGEEMSALQLEWRLDEVVARRISGVGKKLKRAAVRATLYVFFTKMVVGLAIELPYNRFFQEEFVLNPFFINLLFPPALMFLVAFSARPPRPAVAERIIEDAMRIATDEKKLGHARLPRERGPLRLTVFVLVLAALAGGAVIFPLRWLTVLGFSWVDTAVFLVFLSVVSLFAWRVRKPLRELATRGGGGLLWTTVEVIIFPFLAFGRILSDGFRKVNIFMFLLDVFIEAPLKFLFAGVEDWIAFLREKREELIEE